MAPGPKTRAKPRQKTAETSRGAGVTSGASVVDVTTKAVVVSSSATVTRTVFVPTTMEAGG